MRRSMTLFSLVVMFAACSNGTPRASTSGTPGAQTASTSAPRGSTPGGSASARATDTPGDERAPTPAPSGTAPPSAPPRAGTYDYAQDGTTTFGGSSFPSEKTGTLTVERTTNASDGWHQRQTRTYGSDHSRDQDLIFRPSGVYLAQAIEHVGFGQSVTCTPAQPILIVKLPFGAGGWHDRSECSGQQISVDGKTERAERRTVGSASVETYVIDETIVLTGSQYSSMSHEMIWVSPDYRLIVHSTENTSGSYGGADFTRTFSDTLQDLSPR